MLNSFMIAGPSGNDTDGALRLLDLVRNGELYEARVKELAAKEDELRELAGVIDTLDKANKITDKVNKQLDAAQEVLVDAHKEAESIIEQANIVAADTKARAGKSLTEAKERNETARVELDAAKGVNAEADKNRQTSEGMLRSAEKAKVAALKMKKVEADKRKRLEAALRD